MTDNLSLRFVCIGLFVLLVIAFFRGTILYFSPVELFFDEAQYWAWAQALDFGYFSKPPLLAWLIRLFTEFFSNEDYAIRAVSPVLYGLTALMAGLLAARLADRFEVNRNSAFLWTGLLFATLPGISFATRLVSTDAPLLLCFTTALYFLDRLRFDKTLLNAVGLGVAIGFGLMAKYAMVYFIICFFVWAIFSKEARQIVFSCSFLGSLVLAFLILSPNLYWNFSHDWITFQHTKDNGNWQGIQLHFDNMAEFVGAQIGIIGPVLFFVLVLGLFVKRQKLSKDVIFLLAFSLPVQFLMIMQATLSRAHANWAAVSFIALTILAVLWALKGKRKLFLIAAAVIHLIALFVMAGADIYADKLVQTRFGAPYKRVLGWQALSHEVSKLIEKHDVETVVADRRSLVAQMVYHLRHDNVAIKTWPSSGRAGNYYEMELPFKGNDKAPVLVLASCKSPRKHPEVKALPEILIPVRHNFSLHIYPYLSSSTAISKKDVC